MTKAQINLTEGIKNHDAGYETAAWWQDSISDTGVFDLTHVPSPHKNAAGRGLGSGCWSVKLPATVTEDNFQSLWCGNAIGKAYDQKQNAGKRIEFSQVFAIDAFVYDNRFVVTPENLDYLCDTAVAGLMDEIEHVRWALKDKIDETFVEDELYKNCLPGTCQRMHELFERLREVATFRKWHQNTWKVQGERKNNPDDWCHGWVWNRWPQPQNAS